jgi:hypothetical protein
MPELHYGELNDELARRVPDLAGALAQLRQKWGDEEPGPHIVYGDLLVPYLESAAMEGGRSEGLRAAFDLLEEMVGCSHDPEIRNVAGASVMEPLSGDYQVWLHLRPFMGPHTAELASQMTNE